MKKMISLMMCLIALLCLVPTTAIADPQIMLFIGNSPELSYTTSDKWAYPAVDKILSENGYVKASGTSWVAGSEDNYDLYATRSDAEELKLYLHEVSLTDTITFREFVKNKVTIILEGENSIDVSETSGAYGINFHKDGCLNLEGPGSLTIRVSSQVDSFGISSVGVIRINSGSYRIEVSGTNCRCLSSVNNETVVNNSLPVKYSQNAVSWTNLPLASYGDVPDALNCKYMLINPKTHQISTDTSVENGTVTASPTSAVCGTTVTVLATSKVGYELDAISVTETGGVRTVSLEDNHTFIMPDYDVTVSATFKAKPTVTYYGENYISTAKIESAKTRDIGALLYIGLVASSVFGIGYLKKKEH